MSFSARGGWWVVAQVALFALYLLTLLTTDGVTRGLGLGFARVVGWGLLLAAVVTATWATVLHGRSLSPYPAPVEDAVVLDRGPYRMVRHPIYGAVIMAALGIGLLLVNPWLLAMTALFAVFFTAKAGHEEGLLLAALPGYREYRSRVPHRLLPWLL